MAIQFNWSIKFKRLNTESILQKPTKITPHPQAPVQESMNKVRENQRHQHQNICNSLVY